MNQHIIVIGAGVAGLATAWALHQRGYRVEVLERGDIGRESSWAGAGILSLLLPWNYAPELAELARQSQASFPDWLATLGQATAINPEYRRTGMLVLGRPDASSVDWLARHLHPENTPLPEYGPGIWLPEVAQVRNPRLLQALTDALRRGGVTIHEQVGDIRLETAGSEVRSATAAGRHWQADCYVVAAGAWSAELLGPLAAGLPVRPVRGQMLLYKAAPGRLPCIVYEDGKYLVPRADGHILAGSTLEDTGFDKATTEEARASLHGLVARLLPDVAATGPIRHWAGLRPGSPDNVPIVDRHPALDNLYANTGHFRYGVTLAPACAGLLADRIGGAPAGPSHILCAWPEQARIIPS